MNSVVKNFIELTITDIENKSYTQLFSEWYDNHSCVNKTADYNNLNDLFEVFQSVNIDLYHESETARKSIIAEHMFVYIDNLLRDPYVEEVSLPQIINHLNSKLAINLIDLNNIFKEVAKRISGKHKVLIVPFKIKRNK